MKKFCTATIFFKDFSKLDNFKYIAIHRHFCPSFVILTSHCFLIICRMLYFEIRNIYIAGYFLPTARTLIGYFEVTWHLTMKLFRFLSYVAWLFKACLKPRYLSFSRVMLVCTSKLNNNRETTQKREFLCIVQQYKRLWKSNKPTYFHVLTEIKVKKANDRIW